MVPGTCYVNGHWSEDVCTGELTVFVLLVASWMNAAPASKAALLLLLLGMYRIAIFKIRPEPDSTGYQMDYPAGTRTAYLNTC